MEENALQLKIEMFTYNADFVGSKINKIDFKQGVYGRSFLQSLSSLCLASIIYSKKVFFFYELSYDLIIVVGFRAALR